MNGIDFISITKHFGCKVTPISADGKTFLVENGQTTSSQKYIIKGCHGVHIEMWWRFDGSAMGIWGSVMYYWQGHNLTFGKRAFAEAIDYIGTLLQVDLWDSIVNTFEFGAIMQVEGLPSEYIQHHTAAPKEKLKQCLNEEYKGNFTTWKSKTLDLKMYGPNIAKYKTPKEIREELQASGAYNFAESHLKWEARYKAPARLFNHGRSVTLADLQAPKWTNILKEDLYLQYQRLIVMRTFETPTSKKNLTTADIFAMVLAGQGINNGKSLEHLKKMLYSHINSIPNEVLNEADKKARKRQVKATLDKLHEEPQSKYDLTEKLEGALKG